MKQGSGVRGQGPEKKRTPCGYPAGGLRASDGTRYEVRTTGQIVRREPKMGKAELKRYKRERRSRLKRSLSMSEGNP